MFAKKKPDEKQREKNSSERVMKRKQMRVYSYNLFAYPLYKS